MAELVDKSTEHISLIERGERSPSLELLFDISQVFKLSVSVLLAIDTGIKEEIDAIPAPILPGPLPQPVKEPIKPEEQRKSDIERLQECLANIRVMQQLANEYEISDIFQDNGAKFYSY